MSGRIRIRAGKGLDGLRSRPEAHNSQKTSPGATVATASAMTQRLRSRALSSATSVLSGLALICSILHSATIAQAQIKQPGAHGHYSVELEPHASLWWRDHSHAYWDNGQGWGLGLRASIPIVDNGFVSSINNNVAIGFGFDWGRYSHHCWWNKQRDLGGDCTNSEFWFPVVMQWNFFITKAFSVFGEPGLAIRHSRWSWPNGWCQGAGGPVTCDYSDSDTGLEPVFFVGGRVGNENVSFTFRLGWPYASVGASFFL